MWAIYTHACKTAVTMKAILPLHGKTHQVTLLTFRDIDQKLCRVSIDLYIKQKLEGCCFSGSASNMPLFIKLAVGYLYHKPFPGDNSILPKMSLGVFCHGGAVFVSAADYISGYWFLHRSIHSQIYGTTKIIFSVTVAQRCMAIHERQSRPTA